MMKKTITYILVLALVIVGLCPTMAGCANKTTDPVVTSATELSATISQMQTQETTEVSAEDPTEQSTQDIAEQPEQAPEIQATQGATAQSTQKATVKATQTAMVQTTQATTAQPTQTSAAQSTQKATAEPTQGATVQSTQKATVQATQKPAVQPTQKPTEPVVNGQDVSTILNGVLDSLAKNVPEPTFGTLVGEWTVLCLARGQYYQKNDPYFADYYKRIEQIVGEKAASVNQNGALHKAKSTENSRLILALTAIGKDATAVNGWNLIAPYDNFNWIKKQGINGPIWALIALDTGDYQTKDATIRQQCLDHILQKQLADGGWALTGSVSDPDITAMTLQALYPYRDQAAIKKAAEEGFACLSNLQKDNGGYVTFGDENSESCAQVIVACATWGINPDTDKRFIKNGVSVVDVLRSYYDATAKGFKHIYSGKVDAMATDQGCYALIAYQRLLKGQDPLYDMKYLVDTYRERWPQAAFPVCDISKTLRKRRFHL